MRIGGTFLVVSLVGLLSACVQVSDKPKPSEESLKKAANVNVQLGATYLNKGLYGAANEKLQKALKQDSKSVEANSVYAILLNTLGKTKEAEKYFKKSIKLAPEDSKVRNNYGTFLCDHGEIEKAVEQFELALLDPLYNTPEYALANAGACLLKVPDFERAETNLRKALQRNKNLATALYQMARLNYLKGRYAASKAYLDRFHKGSVKSPESLWLGMRLAWQLGDKNTASSYSLLLKNQFPDSQETQKLIQAESTRNR